MPASPKPHAPRVEEDDDLADLPDLDGESGDEGEDEEAPPSGLDLGDEETSDLDDATGEGRDVFGQNDMDLDVEGSFLDDAEPKDDIDLELPEIPGSTVSLLDDREPKPEADDDFDLETADVGPLDAGEEGPTDADEELKDADLPALDADDEGEVDESTLFDVALEEDAPLPWGEERFAFAGAPVECGDVLSVAGDSLGGVALLAGGGLARLDLEGGARRLPARGLPAGATRVRFAHGTLEVEGEGVTAHSHDHGESFEPAGPGPRAAFLREEASLRAALEAWEKALGRVDVLASTRDARGGYLLVVASHAEPRVWLAYGAAHEDAPRLVAEIEGILASDVKDLAWDEARGVVWLGGTFGARALHATTPPRSAS